MWFPLARMLTVLAVVVALVFAGVAVALGELGGEPASGKPPSTRAVARAASPEAAAETTSPPPVAALARVTASLAPAIERTDIVDAMPAPPARSDAVIEQTEATQIAFDPVDRAPGWEQRKGRAALSLVAYDWERIGFHIKFMSAKSGYRGGTFPYEELIEIYVRPELTVEEIAQDIAHELGHAFDWVFNTQDERQLYQMVRGHPADRGWFACSGCTDYATPAGDFAETFAYWTLDQSLPHRGLITTPPSEQQIALLESVLTATK